MAHHNKAMSATPTQKLRVLCADDEPAILNLFQDFLETSGCVVTGVTNGSEAYHAQRQWTYDMIILDVNMPIMGGAEAIMAIRERNKRAYILLISGTTDHAELAKSLENGADAVMKKPFSLATLGEHLTAAEAKRQMKGPILHNPRAQEKNRRSWVQKIIDKVVGKKELVSIDSK